MTIHASPFEAPSVAARSSNSSPLSVLVVDDSKPAAKTIGWTVEALGHNAALAHNGEEALSLARQLLPDAILLDISLPGMSGYEICHALRQDPALRHIVIVAQTGWGTPEHRQLSENAGFDHHLVKPVAMHLLKEIFDTMLAARAETISMNH